MERKIMTNSQLPPTSQMDKARVGLLGKEASLQNETHTPEKCGTSCH